MLYVLPTVIAGPADLPGADPPARSTPLAWTLSALLLALLIAERVAVLALAAWTWLPEAPARLVATVAASLRLYPLGSENAVWAWWSHAAVADDLWQALAGVVLVAVALRACERWLGGLRTLALLAAALPLIGLAWSLAAQGLRAPPAIAGALPLAVALITAVRALHPRAELRGVAGWWLVVLVGVVPLRMGLRLATSVIIAQDLLRCGLLHAWSEVGALVAAYVAALVVGWGLGVALKFGRG